MNVADRPRLALDEVAGFVREVYGLEGTLAPLPGERDQNLRLKATDGSELVVKVAHAEESPAALDLQACAFQRLADHAMRPALYPRIRPTLAGAALSTIASGSVDHQVRLTEYQPGRPIAELPARSPALLADIGCAVGDLSRVLAGLGHPAMHRPLVWDPKFALLTIGERMDALTDGARRAQVGTLLAGLTERLTPVLATLPMQLIHGDANDYNVLVDDDGRLSGIIDFGDLVHSYRACDVANALAYLLLGADDWLAVAAPLLAGYRSVAGLTAEEIAHVGDFARLRLGMSVVMAASQRQADPENAYLSISELPAWDALDRLAGTDGAALDGFLTGEAGGGVPDLAPPALHGARAEHLSPSLSLSYRDPLKIVGGTGAYLYDESGNAYLDCVNNVCHVGHCHPRVVAAITDQAGRLNTNTRYLHDAIVEYARQLTATLPAPLEVCFFVNSGSEANDLALRLARTHTGEEDMVVIDHAYHGHTQALIDVSPYKFNRRGGRGAPATTHVVTAPDVYRGPIRDDTPDAGAAYAESVREAVASITAAGRRPAAFIAESILGCGGQIVLPPDYLASAYAHVRAARGVTIADEVQVGFGRVGSHMWAFETQAVCPDIVTMGKPIGNGHPLAAVVTTRAIAESFANGMEYFNTFGGNPVSCRVGLAVLDVIEDESLMANARDVGERLGDSIRERTAHVPFVGDVRGMGLFLGVEIVVDRETRTPDAERATALVEAMKAERVLLSTDGPHENVLKFKPPIVFGDLEAQRFMDALSRVLAAMGA